MKYYKAKQDCYDYFNKFNVAKWELLTERERNILARYINDDKFEIVNIKKSNTFTSFGCRFEAKGV